MRPATVRAPYSSACSPAADGGRWPHAFLKWPDRPGVQVIEPGLAAVADLRVHEKVPVSNHLAGSFACPH